MKISMKYLSIAAICLVTILSSPSHAVDNHADLENHTFHASSFKLPSLKKMMVLSLAAFSNTVDAGCVDACMIPPPGNCNPSCRSNGWILNKPYDETHISIMNCYIPKVCEDCDNHTKILWNRLGYYPQRSQDSTPLYPTPLYPTPPCRGGLNQHCTDRNCLYPPNRYGPICVITFDYVADQEVNRHKNCLIPSPCMFCESCVKQRWRDTGYRSDEDEIA